MTGEEAVRSSGARGLRAILLGITLLGACGAGAELFLPGHYEDGWQRTPLFALGAGALSLLASLLAPGRETLRLLRLCMLAFLVVGALGVWRHYRSNVEFELEMKPGLQGRELFWESLHGAMPALAPATLCHLGLLGLAATWRHPALGRES